MQPGVVGPAAQVVGVCGLNTVPVCEGGVGIGLGRASTWKYVALPVLETKATFFPSPEIVGDVVICSPDCNAVLYAKATQGVPLLHFGLASVYRLLMPT